jgi:hypothetical protein
VRFLVGASLLALLAAGCGDGGKSSSAARTTTAAKTTAAVVTVSGTHRYSPQVISSFMRSCTRGNAAKEDYCACVIDKLSQSVSTRDFARIARTGRALARVQRAVRRAAAACAGTP